MRKQENECGDQVLSTKVRSEVKQKNGEKMHKKSLPCWCRGIMGGCVNCGGCCP